MTSQAADPLLGDAPASPGRDGSGPPSRSLLIPHLADTRDDLVPVPINPEHILSGNPVARELQVCEVEDLWAGLWDCTAGRFRWYYGDCDETVHIVDGAVTMTDQDGGVVHLRAGDVATFRAGTWVTWDVEDYVKKFAVCRFPPAPSRGRVLPALRRRAKRLLRR